MNVRDTPEIQPLEALGREDLAVQQLSVQPIHIVKVLEIPNLRWRNSGTSSVGEISSFDMEHAWVEHLDFQILNLWIRRPAVSPNSRIQQLLRLSMQRSMTYIWFDPRLLLGMSEIPRREGNPVLCHHAFGNLKAPKSGSMSLVGDYATVWSI